MKKLLIILLLAATCAVSHAQNDLFRKYEDTKGVTTVYVSKAMMNMFPNISVGNNKIEKISRKLDMLRILSCDRPSLIPSIRNYAVAFYKDNRYQLLMQEDDDGEKTSIYKRGLGKNKNEFILLSVERDELNIISVIGNISLNDIRQLQDH
jgi:hypothetical protein